MKKRRGDEMKERTNKQTNKRTNEKTNIKGWMQIQGVF